MREILFRGKRIDNGEWIYGDLRQYSKKCIGIYSFELQQIVRGIDPSTVGQYTGLKANGKRIFEGDIINAHMENVVIKDFVLEVVFHNGRFCGLHEKGSGKMWMPLADGVKHIPQDKTPYMEWCEVIGNIHDNAELMEVR